MSREATWPGIQSNNSCTGGAEYCEQQCRHDHKFKNDLLGGMVVLHHTGAVYQRGAAEKLLYSRYGGDSLRTQKTPLTFIPYYAGANRQATSMQVWSLLLQS
jgi:DUF1680 family protein